MDITFKVDTHQVGDVLLCCSLSRALKDNFSTMWACIPTNDRTEQAGSFLRRANADLDAYYKKDQPATTPSQVCQWGALICQSLAAGYEAQGSLWHAFAKELRTSVLEALEAHLKGCLDQLCDTFRPSTYLSDSYLRASQLVKTVLRHQGERTEELSGTQQRTVDSIQLIPGAGQISQKVSYTPPHLLVRYHRHSTDLFDYIALPLYFFHEIFSHVLPASDLPASWADGWLMAAAHKAWADLEWNGEDELVTIERRALGFSLYESSISNSPIDDIMGSPSFRVANVFAARYPQHFWRVTLEILRLQSDDSPTDLRILVHLQWFLDPHEVSHRKVCAQSLDKIMKKPWNGLRDFAEKLAAARSDVEKRLGLPSFRD